MKSFFSKSLLISGLFVFFISCASDDSQPVESTEVEQVEEPTSEEPIDEEPVVEEPFGTKEELITLIVGSEESKTWRISSAVLTNNFGTIDVSNNTNVLDDEFIFSITDESSGTIVWKRRKGINYNAQTSKNFADDNYSSPLEVEFLIGETVEITNSYVRLAQETETTLKGEIILNSEENSKLEVTLIEKKSEDYKTAPMVIDFKTVETFENIVNIGKTTGFIGSYQTNSLYLSYRNDFKFPRTRKVFKYNVETKLLDSTEISFQGTEFTSSRLHLLKDELIVVGSGRFSRISNDLKSEVINYPYNNIGSNSNLSRAGSAFLDSQIYVLGGNLTILDNPLVPFEIRRINNDSNELEDFSTIQESRIGCEGEIVDSNLFIFGGYKEDNPLDILDTGIMFDLRDNSLSHFDLPKSMYHTSACRYENLIFLAGKTVFVENEPTFYFSVYDTQTNTFIEPQVTFEGIDPIKIQIEGMTILNDILYIALGDSSSSKVKVESVDLSMF